MLIYLKFIYISIENRQDAKKQFSDSFITTPFKYQKSQHPLHDGFKMRGGFGHSFHPPLVGVVIVYPNKQFNQ